LTVFAAALPLAFAACSSVKTSTVKKTSVPRDLYIINAKTGAVNQNFPDTDIENYGIAYTAVSDGRGGWYIGGGFSRVGKVSRNGLARLRSDGSLDLEFAPRLPKTTRVWAIARQGNVVYAYALPSIVAAFDVTSGRRLWQVLTDAPPVYDFSGGGLAFADGTLFVGGDFSRIAGVLRSGLAALDPRTGKPTSWRVRLIAEGGPAAVGAMSFSNGLIYFEGSFGLVNGAKRNLGMAAVSARTGEVTPWNPQPSVDLYEATAILATHGQVLAGGKGFAAYDARTGRVLPWYKRLGGCPNAFAVSGNTVYLGAFPYQGCSIMTSAGGRPVHNLAAVVLPSGMVTNWRPIPSPTPYVRAIAVSGQNVLVTD